MLCRSLLPQSVVQWLLYVLNYLFALLRWLYPAVDQHQMEQPRSYLLLISVANANGRVRSCGLVPSLRSGTGLREKTGRRQRSSSCGRGEPLKIGCAVPKTRAGRKQQRTAVKTWRSTGSLRCIRPWSRMIRILLLLRTARLLGTSWVCHDVCI